MFHYLTFRENRSFPVSGQRIDIFADTIEYEFVINKHIFLNKEIVYIFYVCIITIYFHIPSQTNKIYCRED